MKLIKFFFKEAPKQNRYNILSTEINEEVQVGLKSSTILYLTGPAQKIEIAYLRTKSLQDILSTEGNFEEDFSIQQNSSQTLIIKGNLKTALIVLRHQGLISADETQVLLEEVNGKIGKEGLNLSIKQTNLKEIFENNYRIACYQFSPSEKEQYQRDI